MASRPANAFERRRAGRQLGGGRRPAARIRWRRHSPSADIAAPQPEAHTPRRRGCCRSCATARLTSSRSATSSPSTPTRTTPTVFDGTSKFFCPLPIGEVEARLDHAHFVRVHRSHIVNLERVVGLKRSGDHGLIELSGHDPYTVPVSRSRFGGLKSQLGLGPREAVASPDVFCTAAMSLPRSIGASRSLPDSRPFASIRQHR